VCSLVDNISPFLTFLFLTLPQSQLRRPPLLWSRPTTYTYPIDPPRRACSFESSTHFRSYIMSALSSPALSFCDSLSSPDLDAYLDSLSPLSQLPSPTMKEAWWREETLHGRHDSSVSDISSSCKSFKPHLLMVTWAYKIHSFHCCRHTMQHYCM
jgi:hypothetical protein